jgi:hypothetical protein
VAWRGFAIHENNSFKGKLQGELEVVNEEKV